MIRYLKLFYSYILKRRTMLTLLLTAIIPSLIVGVILTPFAEMSAFFEPKQYYGKNFLEIYWSTTGLNSLWLLRIVGVIVLSMAVTLIVATVDRHMRLGDLRFRNPLMRINDNIWAVFPVFVVFIVTKEIFDIVFSLVVYLSLPLAPALYAVIVVAGYVLVYFGFSIVMAYLLMWVPHSFATGLSAPKSFASSVKLTSGHVFRLALTIFMGVLPVAVVVLLASWAGGVIQLIASAGCYLVLSIFIVVLMYVVYYDTTGMEREDINVVDIWDKRHDV